MPICFQSAEISDMRWEVERVKGGRPVAESNRRIKVLQTSALPLGERAVIRVGARQGRSEPPKHTRIISGGHGEINRMLVPFCDRSSRQTDL
jgi:hypothetical protein